MDQHPIPQNVTQYEFKLIGFMTLKQFGMLGGFLLIAYVITKLPLIPGIFTWPIAFSLGTLGLAIAFVPYEERTLDIWLINFIKSIYRPTQYLWKKQVVIPDYFSFTKKTISTPEIVVKKPSNSFQNYSQSLAPIQSNPLDKKQLDEANKFSQMFSTPSSDKSKTNTSNHAQQFLNTPPSPSLGVLKNENPAGGAPRSIKSPPSRNQIQNILFQNQVKLAQKKIGENSFEDSLAEQSQQHLNQTIQKNISPKPDIKITTPPIPQPTNIPTQKQSVPRTNPMDSFITKAPPITPPLEIKSIYPEKKERIRVVAPQFLSDVNIPISPNTPNIIVGMVLTRDEKLIPNTIVEISDKNNIPVRAVKSNKLGQFFIATPIKNGVYSISAEHQQYKFDTIKIEARGEIIPPLKIISIN